MGTHIVRRSLLGVLVVITAACGAGSGSASSVAPTAVATASARPSEPALSDAIVASIDVGHQGTSMAVGGGSVWIRTTDGHVLRFDSKTGTIVADIAVGESPYGSVRFGAGAVWVSTFDSDVVSRIDPATNTVVAEIPVGRNPEGMTVTADAVWVSNHRGGSISHIDPATNKVVATIKVGPEGRSGPKGIVLAGGSLWTTVPNEAALVRFDPTNDQVVRKIPIVEVEDLTSNGTSLFVYSAGHVLAIDAKTEKQVEASPKVGPGPFANGAFWGFDAGSLWKLDASTLAPGQSWRVTNSPTDYPEVVVDGQFVWLLLPDELRLLKLAL